MVTKHREEACVSRGRSVRRECWQMQLRLMAGRNGYVSSVPKPMCGLVVSLTSRLVCKESTRRLSLRRIKGWYLGSFSSSSDERKPGDQEEELKRLRAKVELLSEQERWGKGPERDADEKGKWSGRGLQDGG